VSATSIPAGPAYPAPLQGLGWFNRPGPFMKRCRARYGDVFSLHMPREGTWVMLADPGAVKQVFTGDPQVFHAGEANGILRPVVGEHSVLLLDEQAHMTQRKLMLPPFHGERMQRFGDLIAGVTAEEVARWPREEPMAVLPRMQTLTLEIVMRAIFGIHETDRLDHLRRLLHHMTNWTTQPRQILGFVVLGYDRVRRSRAFRAVMDPVDEALLDEIRRRRADPATPDRDDILSMLVQARHEDGRPMTDVELRDELMTLLIAGHETTATALSWALERLVRHPEMLERLADEAQAGEEAYADAVVKETLRLRPVLPIVLRRLTEPVEIAGHRLPAGVNVAPCIYLLHRRADLYPEPERFRPERFLERPAGTYTWIPFGGGVRRCLGASFALFEMRTVLQVVARSGRLRPAQPESERVRRRAITLTPARGGELVVA